MENLEVTVGNTVDFFVDVEGMENDPTEAKLYLYRKKEFPDGLTDLIEVLEPSSISGQTILFTFDTDAMAPHPMSIYGRFFVNDQNKKINAYFKLKFTY
jgi:hypothetical protein